MTTTSGPVRPRPAAHIPDAGVYSVPRPDARVDLRLDGNEGSHPGAALVRELEDAATLARSYPDAAPLEADLAARLGLDARRVLVTAGADEALDRVFRAFVERGRNVVLPEPTFVMLRRYANLAHGAIRSVPWPRGAYPVDAVIEAIDPSTAIVSIVSPNNPTGAVATPDDLVRIAAAAPHALVLVDAAYAEFARQDLTPMALEIANAVVVRSLSKAWGLAGCRIGYVAGPAEVVDMLRSAGSPYSVAGPSLAIARRRLREDEASMQEFVARVRTEIETLRTVLTESGIESEPSQANFVLAKPRDALAFWRGLAERGIAVRAFPNDALLGDCVRITCPGDAALFDRLAAAIREVAR